MNNLLILLAVSLAPGALLFALIRRMDANEKEPLGLVSTALFMGALSAVPAIFLELALGYLPIYGGGLLGAFNEAFLQVSWVEEGVKLLFVYWLIRKNPHYNEENDGIVYFGAGALGFAIFENMFYVLGHGFGTGLARAVSAVPMHCFNGVVMGFFLGKARMEPNRLPRRRLFRKGFIYPFILHGVYDFLLMTGAAPLMILVIPFVIGMFVVGFRLMRQGRAMSQMRSSLTEGRPEEAAEIWKRFEATHPKNQLWKIIVSRTLFVFVILFWIALGAAFAGDWKKAGQSPAATLAIGVMIAFIPLLMGILLEISHRRNRKKRQILIAQHGETVSAPPRLSASPAEPPSLAGLWPPGQLWRAVAGRFLLALGVLLVSLFALVFMADFEDYKHEWFSWLLLALGVSFPFLYPGLLTEFSFRARRRRFFQLARIIPPAQIGSDHLTLSPAGTVWKIIVSRTLFGFCASVWMVFGSEIIKGVSPGETSLVEMIVMLLFLTMFPLLPAIFLERSHQRQKKAFNASRLKEDPVSLTAEPS